MREVRQALLYFVCAALLASIPVFAYNLLLRAPGNSLFPAAEAVIATGSGTRTKPDDVADQDSTAPAKQPVWIVATTEYNYKPPAGAASRPAQTREKTISRDKAYTARAYGSAEPPPAPERSSLTDKEYR